jgi:hypothetical protein
MDGLTRRIVPLALVWNCSAASFWQIKLLMLMF